MRQKILVGIIGGHNVRRGSAHWKAAVDVGRAVAKCGWVVVTGGLGGVMEAASAGAAAEGGLVIGILPQADKSKANKFVQIGIATGLGEARNVLIARSADALVAIAGGYGTLTEIGFGLMNNKPVVGVLTQWDIPGMKHARSVAHAISLLKKELSFGSH